MAHHFSEPRTAEQSSYSEMVIHFLLAGVIQLEPNEVTVVVEGILQQREVDDYLLLRQRQ